MRMRFFVHLGEASICLVVLGVLSSAVGCSKQGDGELAPRAERAIAVRVVGAETRTMQERVDYVGMVRFEHEIKVRARVPGTLTDRGAKEGERVRAGDVLATLSSPEMLARVRSVGEEVGKAQVQMELACSVYRTDERLHAKGALPKVKLDASRTNCRAAKRGLASAKARLSEVRSTLAHTRELAPRAGLVLDWLVQEGEYVGPGQPMLMLGAGAKIVEVKVTDMDLARGIRVGTQVLISTPNEPGREHRTEVYEVDPMATGPGHVVGVRMALPEDLQDARWGATMRVGFSIREHEGTTAVPLEALTRSAPKAVFALEGEVVHRVPVELGIEQDGWVEVRSDEIQPGTPVVTTNLGKLSDGMKVYPVREASAVMVSKQGGQR